MKEMHLKAWGEEFILNNNSGKFDRTAQEVGDKSSPESFLGVYDKFGGLILDKDRKKISNGIFWKRYSQWKEEQPKYLKILEERERTLDEGEKRMIELISQHVGHKRAFLGTLMTISAAVIAGLFLLISSNDSNGCLSVLSIISGLGFAFFIISSSSYLTWILSKEGISLDGYLKFVKDSKKDFIKRIGVDIFGIDSYEQYREQKYKEEVEVKPKEKITSEKYFVGICALFIISAILLLPMLLSPELNLCSAIFK